MKQQPADETETGEIRIYRIVLTACYDIRLEGVSGNPEDDDALRDEAEQKFLDSVSLRRSFNIKTVIPNRYVYRLGPDSYLIDASVVDFGGWRIKETARYDVPAENKTDAWNRWKAAFRVRRGIPWRIVKGPYVTEIPSSACLVPPAKESKPKTEPQFIQQTLKFE